MKQALLEKLETFLENQVREMVFLDEQEGISKPGTDFHWRKPIYDRGLFGDDIVGKTVGIHEFIYRTMKEDILSNLRRSSESSKLYLSLLGIQDELKEDTISTDAPTFTTALLPAVRRIYSQLIAMELVSVQPLTNPTGYIWFLDHLYDTTDAGEGITAGDRMDNARPDAYALSAEQGTMQELSIQIQRLLVSTINYKLLAKWTLESEQDFKSQWKTDVDGEISPQLLNEIAREIDALLINALFNGSDYQANWNSAGYLAGDTSTFERKQYDATIYDAILDCNSEILQKTTKGANVLLMGAATLTRLMKLEGFKLDPAFDPNVVNISRNFVGILNGLFKVYVVSDLQRINSAHTNKILVMRRGTDWQESVAYFAPYIPLFLSEKYMINDDFTQFARGSMSRFAYGVIPKTPTDGRNEGIATVEITSS